MRPVKEQKVHPIIGVIIGWLVGNVLWSILLFLYAKIAKDVAMTEIGAIGFLVLIVLGIGGSWYFLFRERQSPAWAIPLENMARYITMMLIAQQYNVKPSDLADLNNPQAMEERAKRLQAEKALSDLSKVKLVDTSPSNADKASSQP